MKIQVQKMDWRSQETQWAIIRVNICEWQANILSWQRLGEQAKDAMFDIMDNNLLIKFPLSVRRIDFIHQLMDKAEVRHSLEDYTV